MSEYVLRIRANGLTFEDTFRATAVGITTGDLDPIYTALVRAGIQNGALQAASVDSRGDHGGRRQQVADGPFPYSCQQRSPHGAFLQSPIL